MGSSGGGSGTTTSSSEATPEVRELQQLAIPQIRAMLSLNPLEQYAVSQPRQIAGTNPFYEQAFGLTPALSRPTASYETLYGSAPSIFPGEGAIPPLSSGLLQTSPSGPPSGQPAPQTSTLPTPGFGASIQDLVNQQVQQALAAQTMAPNAAIPPPIQATFRGSDGLLYQLPVPAQGVSDYNG